MKASKYLAILLALSGAALLSGCTKEYYEVNEGVEMYMRDFEISSDSWDATDALGQNGEPNGGLLLYIPLKVPEITDKVVSYGNVTVSRKLYDNGKVFWTPLPCSRAEALRYGETDEYFYSTYLDYEWGVNKQGEGIVTVYFTATDLEIETDDKGNIIGPEMELRVTVMI